MYRFTDAILRTHAQTTKKHLEERHFGCTLVEDEKEAFLPEDVISSYKIDRKDDTQLQKAIEILKNR